MILAFRSIAASLALCAMVLRALLPMGWMPAADIASAGPFVICTVDGTHKDRKAPADSQQRLHAPCAFAAAAPLAPPVAASTLRVARDVAHLAFAFADEEVLSGSRHRQNAARGPPSLA